MEGFGGSSRESSRKEKSKRGFSNLTRESHFQKHGKEYGAKDSKEYETAAIALKNKDITKDIVSFGAKNGLIFKYDKGNNDFLIYEDNGEIVTLFKPEKGLDYWNRQVELYEQ